MTRNTYLAGVLGVVMLLTAAAPVYASTLTSAQASAVVSLLQSFGVDQQTVTNVEIALGVATPISPVTFVATPTSGTAPLAVSFHASGLSYGTAYVIDYGDGQNSGPLNTVEPPCAIANSAQCSPIITNSHAYSTSGTYTAILTPYVSCLYSNPRCMIATQLLGSEIITVTGQSTTGGLSVSGLDAPSQLAVGQTGTWTVHVSNVSGQLSYSVIWGDEVHGIMTNAAPTASTVNTSGTFTHAYMTVGTYTPTFTVSSNNGTAQTNATVVVGTTSPPCACPMILQGSSGTPSCNCPTPTPLPCIGISSNLGIGSSGSGVAALQQSLGVASTGYFGPVTKAAVANWQTSHNIAATGYLGPITRSAMATFACPTGSLQLYSLSPSAGSVGTVANIIGLGFTSNNTILLDGSVAARNVPITSSSAITCTTDPSCHGGIQQTLRFTVPSSIAPNCPVGSMCPMYIRLVTPGQYNVSVQNVNGTSNTAVFTVSPTASQ